MMRIVGPWLSKTTYPECLDVVVGNFMMHLLFRDSISLESDSGINLGPSLSVDACDLRNIETVISTLVPEIASEPLGMIMGCTLILKSIC
jgi:hypothetical protein